MRFAALLLLGPLLLGCSSMGDRYVRETSASCGTGDRLACETLATMHPQALLDADAIMAGHAAGPDAPRVVPAGHALIIGQSRNRRGFPLF